MNRASDRDAADLAFRHIREVLPNGAPLPRNEHDSITVSAEWLAALLHLWQRHEQGQRDG